MLTIVICTHNRSKDVELCLAALYPQVDFSIAEILLIDSGSNAAEADRLADLATRVPEVRLIRLDEPGLSLARNRALAEGKSDWIAFLDDDAVPAPDWFVEAVRLTRTVPASCAVIGGEVTPIFPEGAKPVIGRRWSQLLSLVAQPDEAFGLSSASICGANVMYRAAPLKQVGGFPLELGRVGSKLLSGEEKLTHERLTAASWRVGRSSRLKAGHRISAARLKRNWACERAYWDGVSDQRIGRLLGQRVRLIEGLSLFARLPVLAALYYPLSGPDDEVFVRFWYTLGRLREIMLPVRATVRASSAPLAAPPRPQTRLHGVSVDHGA